MRITPYRAAVTVLSLAIIAVLGVTFLPRIAGGSPAVPTGFGLTRGFACKVSATYQGSEYKADFSCPASGRQCVTFTAPAALQGLTLALNGNSLAVSYNSIGGTLPAEALPQRSLFSSVLEAVSAASRKGVKAERTKTGYTVKGKTDAGAFVLSLDKTRVPTTLEFPDIGLTVKFTDFKLAS